MLILYHSRIILDPGHHPSQPLCSIRIRQMTIPVKPTRFSVSTRNLNPEHSDTWVEWRPLELSHSNGHTKETIHKCLSKDPQSCSGFYSSQGQVVLFSFLWFCESHNILSHIGAGSERDHLSWLKLITVACNQRSPTEADHNMCTHKIEHHYIRQ